MIQSSEKQLASFDGTKLGYRVYGTRGPWLVLVNGLGSTYDSWEQLLGGLVERWRVLVWDLRGLYGSAVPADRRRLTVADHCRDLEALLDAEGIPLAVVGGWSMGVQIALEASRRLPEQVAGLVLINGTYGRFFSACFHVPLPGLVLPPALRLGRASSPLISRLVTRAGHHPRFATALHRLGVTASASPLIAQAATHFARLDWDVYLQMAGAMQDHDAQPALPLVQVPTLVVGGGRDPLAPRRIIERMAGEIPEAELFYLPLGTHYTQLEFPGLVARRIDRFLGAHFAQLHVPEVHPELRVQQGVAPDATTAAATGA